MPAPQPPKRPTREQLAVLDVRRVIFHDVPRKLKGIAATPTLSDVDSSVDAKNVQLLREKLVKVLTSSAAYDLDINETPQSSVPELVKSILENTEDERTVFVVASKEMANTLVTHQTGSASAGLLTVIDCKCAGCPAVAILKLEREDGLQLNLRGAEGEKTFEMAVLSDLVLTGGTKLFKAALFVQHGDDVVVIASDDQRSYTTSQEMAHFWRVFLGCKLREEPRIVTRKFYEATVAFINEEVTDPVFKNDLHDHIVSELKKNTKNFAPKRFIEACVPPAIQDSFKKYMEKRNIALKQFELNTSEISRYLRKRSIQTSQGVRVTIPTDSENLVDVKANRIVIDDKVLNVE
jgi:hypothetical protein